MDGNLIKKEAEKQDTIQYKYDPVGRLIEEEVDGGEFTRYIYDRFGNRWVKDTLLDDGHLGSSHEYDANNRLISTYTEDTLGDEGETYQESEYQYDGNGNLVAELVYADGNAEPMTKRYKYDYKNRLIETDTHRYTYRADGYLLYKSEKQEEGIFYGDIFYWDQGNLIAIKSEKRDETWRISDREIQTFVRGLAGEVVLASDDPGNRETDRYYYYDAHGDIVNTIDCSTDSFVSDAQYDAYGNRKESSVVDEKNPFGYAGEYLDEDTGFIYLRNRFYSPEIGRFISEDPIRDGLNWYAYAGNNPVMYVDPLGLEKIIVSGGVYSQEKKNNGTYNAEFLDTAIKDFFKQYIGRTNNELITLVVADEGWTDYQKGILELSIYGSRDQNINVNLVYINSANELVDYILSGTNNSRGNDPISYFSAFSHGFDDMVTLGYNYSTYNKSLNLTKDHITDAFGNAFAKTSITNFYACNTGTNKNDSFAQKWANKTGSITTAAVGKTDYEKIFKGASLHSRFLYNLHGFAAAGGATNYPTAGNNAYFKIFYGK